MLNAVSLFSGCLGFDLGLEAAGIKTIAYVEKDRACQATIKANRPGVPLFPDISHLTGADITNISKKVDIVVGGPPCQSYSTIGKRGSVGDPT